MGNMESKLKNNIVTAIEDMKADKKVRPPAFTSKDVENKRSYDLFLIQLLMKTLPEITLYMNCRFLCPLIPVP